MRLFKSDPALRASTTCRWRLALAVLGTAVLALAWPSAGCGGATTPGTDASSGRYKITIVEAALASHRPDGSAWHVRQPDGSAMLIGGLAGVALGNPLVGLAVGGALEGGATEHPPSPYVELKIGAQTFATLPAGATLSPRWLYPFAVDITGMDMSEPVIILVRDAYDKGVISQARMPLAELIHKPLTRLFELGSVITLELAVERLPSVPEHKRYRLSVPANMSAEELVRTESASAGQGHWRRVPVLNGDTVAISALGEVCPSSRDPGDCFDANGAAGRWQGYNYPEFRDAPHAALVAFYADVPVLIGSSTIFRAQRSGWLMLFVNDTDAGNNTGGFQVRVEVNPPDYNP
jgi:hypothetical protein